MASDEERARELLMALNLNHHHDGDRRMVADAFAAVRADERSECQKVEDVAASPEMDAARALSLAHYCRQHESAEACVGMILAIFKRLRAQGAFKARTP